MGERSGYADQCMVQIKPQVARLSFQSTDMLFCQLLGFSAHCAIADVIACGQR